jgi:hypothetical protein
LCSLDKKNETLALFFDFTKAFDLVSHNHLLFKLERLGIRGIPLQWLKSYLENISQVVTLNVDGAKHTS